MKGLGRRMQYMSPLVKQDMAKLDKNGESCHIAMKSLKHCVENLESALCLTFSCKSVSLLHILLLLLLLFVKLPSFAY